MKMNCNYSFGRYLKYLLKKSLLCNISLSIVSSVILLNSLEQYITHRHWGGSKISLILMFLSLFMPIITFADLNNKRTLDTIYSMPISRKDIALAKYLCGAISVVEISMVIYIVHLLFIVINNIDLNIYGIMLFDIASLVYCLAIYTFFVFIFTKANTTFDGILFCIFWSIVIGLILFGILYVLCVKMDYEDSLGISDYIFCGVVQAPLYGLFRVLTNMISGKKYGLYTLEELTVSFGYPFWMIICSVCGVIFFKTYVKKKPENVNEISNSILGYKFLIPATTISFLLIFLDAVILNAFVVIGMVIGYVIYRRGFRFHKSDLFFISICLVKTVITVFVN